MLNTTEDIVAHIREWALDKIESKDVSDSNAEAIALEFQEWIDPEGTEIEILSYEIE